MKTLLLLLSLTLSISAQSITATTADGKIVALNPDGTWKYAASESGSILTIEAALVYRSGTVKPVARTQFTLLDADLRDILADAKLIAPGEVYYARDSKEQLLISYGKASFQRLQDHLAFWAVAQKAVAPHVVKTATTGFDGKATFETVPANKTYYLIAVHQTAQGWALWNLKIEPKPGENKILIDTGNAAFAY